MKILVALDGSAAAYAALRTALGLGRRAGAYVTCCYVNKAAAYTPEETNWSAVANRMAQELHAQGERVLEEAREIGRARGVAVEGLLATGNPSEQIAAYVAAHGIVKLVAVGHSSKSRGAQGFVESTTRNLILDVGVPVLVTSVERDVARILVAVEDPGTAARSARAAALLARAPDTAVTLLSVIPDAKLLLQEYGRLAESHRIGAHADELEASFRLKSSQALAAAADVLHAFGIAPRIATQTGDPGHEVLAEAGRHDLVVAGIRQGNLRTRAMGPVARAILDERWLTSLFVQ